MAKKRVITVKVQDEDDDVPEDGSGPGPKHELSWVEWFKGTYAFYWYIILILVLDIFIILQANMSIDWPYSLLTILLIITALSFIQYHAYRLLWGEGGRWRYH